MVVFVCMRAGVPLKEWLKWRGCGFSYVRVCMNGCVFARACVRACLRWCVRACLRVCEWVGVCARACPRLCVLACLRLSCHFRTLAVNQLGAGVAKPQDQLLGTLALHDRVSLEAACVRERFGHPVAFADNWKRSGWRKGARSLKSFGSRGKK